MILQEHFLWEEKAEKNIITTTIPPHILTVTSFPRVKRCFSHYFFLCWLFMDRKYSLPVLNMYF